MTVTVYGRSECVQCDYTKKKLGENHVPYTYLDIDEDAEARKMVEDSGKTQLPMVVVKHVGKGQVDVWHGFRPDHIKGLSKDS